MCIIILKKIVFNLEGKLLRVRLKIIVRIYIIKFFEGLLYIILIVLNYWLGIVEGL